MDPYQVKTAMEAAFIRDLGDGTIEVRTNEDGAVLDGGNWTLVAHTNGVVSLGLPMNDPNYYDDNTEIFLENVLGVEVEESLTVLDRSLGGAIVQGLRRSGESWSNLLAERLTAMSA